jgi:hypothetical protein
MANAEDASYKLLLSEYDSAAQRFFGAGVKEIMEAQGGVYSLVSKEPIEQVPDYSLDLPGGDALGGRPIEASSVVAINRDDVINGNFDSVLSAMYNVAVEMEGKMSKVIMAHISEICDRTGNVVTGELSHDAIIDIIEQTEFSFDEDGNPNLNIVPSSPEARERLRALGEPTAEQKARFDGIISRRRDEWNARRSSRSLPSRRD